jgi:transcriptional regulator with XRE-family HTH domain
MRTAVKRKSEPKDGPKEAPLPILSERLKDIRRAKNLSLTQVSELTGISRSTLYKVENSGVSLTYDKLVQLSRGLKVDIAELFSTPQEDASRQAQQVTARMSTGNLMDGEWLVTENYDYLYLANELRMKRMIPSVLKVHKKALREFGDLVPHPGEEFTIVLSGAVEIHTQFYQPVRLERGMYMYMDSTMAHAYVSVSKEEAVVLTLVSSHEDDLKQHLEGLAVLRS